VARDPYEYFRVEAREILEGLGRGVLQLEKGDNPDVTANLLRLAHTLKGAARVVRQPRIAEHAHAIEECLAPVRDSGAAITRDLIDRLLHLADAISVEVAALEAPPAARPSEAPSSVPVEDGLRPVRAEAADMDTLLDAVAEASVQLHGLRRIANGVDKSRRLSELLVEQLAPRAAGASPAGATFSAPKAGAVAEDLRGLIGGVERNLTTAIEQTERELREVREAAERLRLLPASTLFTPLERVTRDTAPTLGKEASFVARGGDVRLEATVLGIVQSALIQMVRNAVAHGIEPAAERARVGKPRAGRVELKVTRRGNRVAFACHDDGRGIDVDAVRRVAERRGLLPSGGAGDVLHLLLKGGLTTAGTVTHAAGRGIGLDVVREAATRLGGDVTVDTEAGRGTTLTLNVPLSLSALDAILVEVGGVSAAIPLDAVRRTIRLAGSDVTRTAEGEAIVYEGKVIPFMPLGRALGQKVQISRADKARSAVVIASSDALAAVGIGRLRGVANLVVRPLPLFAPAAPFVSGAALDADGTPQLVLDAAGLVATANRHAKTEPPPTEEAAAVVLVVDDSLTTRMMERSILESAGYEVDFATSGEEGLDKALKRRYQLFLVDVEMPGMDGFSFVERTRADPALREVPAILVTSRNTPDDRRRGAEAGASDYVVKGDFDQNALLATIRGLVGR
jgi:two-component system chemotaxis sensor kinase CheA